MPPIEDIQFHIGGDGLPDVINTFKLSKAQKKLIEIEDYMKQIFNDMKILEYNEVVRDYRELSGYSESTVKRHVGTASQNHIIKKVGNGYILNNKSN